MGQRRRARWSIVPSETDKEHVPVPDMSNADLVALRVRVIALENLLISLLATASDQQLELVRDMAGYISPRPASPNIR